MASGALFGNAGTRSQSKNLVEFRAGKMFMKGNMVNPDKRKGQVYIFQSDDSLMHFCWKDRGTGTVENDLIIFPDDIEFKRVSQCTTGRVYVLKFKSSTKKFFFWMQEPKTDKDEDVCKKVNEYLNNPPEPGSSRGRGGAGGLASDLAGDTDLQSMLGNMSQQQLMQLLGGMGMSGLSGLSNLMGGRPSSAQSTNSEPPLRVQSSPGSRATTAGESTPTSQTRPLTAAALPTQEEGTTASTPTPAPATGAANSRLASARQPIQLIDLQNILSNITVPENQQKDAVNLAQALHPESLIPILANPDVQQRLIPYLPDGEALPKTEEELRNTVQSPQFQQALGSFSLALQSGQLGPLMPQFGLGEDVANAAAQGDLEAFVRAMQSKGEEGASDKPADKAEKKKEDE